MVTSDFAYICYFSLLVPAVPEQCGYPVLQVRQELLKEHDQQYQNLYLLHHVLQLDLPTS